MKRYGFIFARGGSKGVRGKNFRNFCGKPLIAWAIEAGLNSNLLDCVVVSTDSPEIAEIANAYGARTPFMRPAELAQDNSPEWLAWRHAITFLKENGEEFDTFVSLPATSPLRTVEDIDICIKRYDQGDCDLLLTCQPPNTHPMFNIYREAGDGHVVLYDRVSPPITRRQDAPKIFDGTGIAYISSPKFILAHNGIWEGKVAYVEFPREKAVDIDDELDFKFAEYLMKEKLAKESGDKDPI